MFVNLPVVVKSVIITEQQTTAKNPVLTSTSEPTSSEINLTVMLPVKVKGPGMEVKISPLPL